jgi:enoyl-[acyl-carrier protein] reductase I
MDFLQLQGKTFLILGLANRKSVAWAVGQALESAGARVIFTVRNETRLEGLQKLLGERSAHICDVEFPDQIEALGKDLLDQGEKLDGFVHSIAFANYSEGFKPFEETLRQDYLQATAVSSFSLVELARALRPVLTPDASVVTIGISSIEVTADNYGYMAPIKAALEASVRFLAKSYSRDSRIRFNTVKAGPLKTSASAGIPGYLESYLYAEKMTLRKEALRTEEVANTVAFLLSPRSSGINGQGIVVNAGMDINYFDRELVRLTLRPEKDPS